MKNKSFKKTERICTQRRLIFLLVLVLAISTIIIQPAVAGQEPVVKINDAVLTNGDLQEAINTIIPAGVFHGGFSAEKRMEYRPQAIEKMIEDELFYQRAVKKNLQFDGAVIDKQRERTIKRLGGKKRFQAALQSAGISEEQYRAKLVRKLLIEELKKAEIINKARISDAEVADYYRRNKAKFMRPEARKIRQIQISVAPNASEEERKQKRLRAQEVIDKINGGEDMVVAAWEYTDDRYRVKGGDMGLVHKGRLDPDLEREVFKLEVDQLSDIIETIYGFHVVRVEVIKDPVQLSLEDIAGKIKKDLTEKKEEQLRQELIENLKAKARVEIF